MNLYRVKGKWELFYVKAKDKEEAVCLAAKEGAHSMNLFHCERVYPNQVGYQIRYEYTIGNARVISKNGEMIGRLQMSLFE